MQTIAEIAQTIKRCEKFVIFGHSIPDGDCVGSVLALYLGLLQLGKQVKAVLPEEVPQLYRYLEGAEAVGTIELDDMDGVAIFLDCADELRVMQENISQLKNYDLIINMDHHPSNNLFADMNYVDPRAAATAEIVFQLLLDLRVDITIDIANALYAGLVMDSGRFMNSNTGGDTLRIAAGLLESGVDINQVRSSLFESKSWAEVRLLSLALQSIKPFFNGQVAVMQLAYTDIIAAEAKGLHPEGIIDYARSIEGVEIAVLLREIEPEQVKIGFRSRSRIDVARVAAKLGGGGHRQAAGAVVNAALPLALERVLTVIGEVI